MTTGEGKRFPSLAIDVVDFAGVEQDSSLRVVVLWVGAGLERSVRRGPVKEKLLLDQRSDDFRSCCLVNVTSFQVAGL